jgi:hypothetical protein
VHGLLDVQPARLGPDPDVMAFAQPRTRLAVQQPVRLGGLGGVEPLDELERGVGPDGRVRNPV